MVWPLNRLKKNQNSREESRLSCTLKLPLNKKTFLIKRIIITGLLKLVESVCFWIGEFPLCGLTAGLDKLLVLLLTHENTETNLINCINS